MITAAIVLSHEEQLARLGRSCPEAVPSAVVAGDPCYDRILASLHRRREYRGALRVRPHQKLILLTSTWGPGSLIGQAVEFPTRLLAQLPMDEYRVVAAVHPNVWVWHSPIQVRAWLDEAMRAGLHILPPREGWRAALIAADLVIGDHGSVTVYGATIDRPVLLAAGDPAELDPAGSTARLLNLAPWIEHARPLRQQVDQTISRHVPGQYADLASGTFALPGESLETLRSLLYGLMRLPVPSGPSRARSIGLPEPEAHTPTSVLVSAEVRSAAAGVTVEVCRFPAVADRPRYAEPMGTDTHLVVDIAESDLRMLESADIIIRRTPIAEFSAEEWMATTLENYPGCRIAADISSTGRCLLRLRDGSRYEIKQNLGPSGPLGRQATVDAEVLASVCYAWLVDGRPLGALAAGVDVIVGALRVQAVATANPGRDQIEIW